MSTATNKQALCEIGPSRLLGMTSMLWMNMYGLLLGLPVLAAIMWVSFQPLAFSTYLVPLAAVAAATFCLPLGFGNTYVRRLARKMDHPPGASLVQLTTVPRLRNGLRALLEDADDIGWLEVNESYLSYRGDSVHMQIPIDTISEVTVRNIGFRGLFVYGSRICISAPGLPGIRTIEIADRSSFFLPGSRRRISELRKAISKARGVS